MKPAGSSAWSVHPRCSLVSGRAPGVGRGLSATSCALGLCHTGCLLAGWRRRLAVQLGHGWGTGAVTWGQQDPAACRHCPVPGVSATPVCSVHAKPCPDSPPGATVPRPELQDCPGGLWAHCWLPWAPGTGCAPHKGECERSRALAWPWEAATPCQRLPGFGDGGSSSRGALLVEWRLLRVPLVHEHRSVPLRGAKPPAPRVLLCWCRCVQRLHEQGLAGAVHSGLLASACPCGATGAWLTQPGGAQSSGDGSQCLGTPRVASRTAQPGQAGASWPVTKQQGLWGQT